MRNKIVAGNWKMNRTFEEADELAFNISELVSANESLKAQVILCPPFPYLELVQDLVHDAGIYTGAQNLSQYPAGAYTGEISAEMLASMKIDFCIIGHSERRKYFGDTNAIIREKVLRALENDISPVFCCGELLEEREKGVHFQVVEQQLNESVFTLEEGDFRNIVIAYEPVWAIGTGITATPAQAQEMHAFIRKLVKGRYGNGVAQDTHVLYGGSCNSKNAAELFANEDVDGGLIGGASLTADEFYKIIEAAG